MTDTVQVQDNNKNPWWTRWYQNFYAGTPGGRVQEAMRPGSVPNSPVGKEEPQKYGISALGGTGLAIGRGIEEQVLNAADAINRFFTSRPQAGPGQGLGSLAYSQTPGPDLGGQARTAGRQRSMAGRNERSEAYRQAQAVEEPAAMTFEEYMAGRQFDDTPYRNYMDFLATQDAETMARVNAMYEQLAGEAAANMQRVADVYNSAQASAGDIYGGAAQNIEQAYGSASQQAADQMARLGIEAAAPTVINPMALSQAEAVAATERAGAGALDALGRYGASARDFGGQMAQVGQQQGLEVSQQILRDMAQRQAEAAFQMEQARANYNPYASALQEMEARQAFQQMQNPQTDPEMEFKAIQYFTDTTLSRQQKLISLQQDLFNAGVQNRKYTNDAAGMEQAFQDALALLQRAEATFPLQ